MEYTIRVITDGGELVRALDLGYLDEVTAFTRFAEAEAPAEGEILQLIGDDLIAAEILG